MVEFKKLIAITGASSGIGAATARLFASKNYPLLLLARRHDRLEQLKLPNTLSLPCDVTNEKQYIECLKKGEDHFKQKIDCLINNAGVMLLSDPFKQSQKEWERMVDVNIKGVLYGTQAVMNDMKARKSGTIINVGSVSGRKNYMDATVYCAAKAFVHSFNEGLRQEIALAGVRVITMAPCMVETELLDHITDETAKRKKQDLKKTFNDEAKALPPDDIANAIMYCYELPQYCCVREMVIGMTKQVS